MRLPKFHLVVVATVLLLAIDSSLSSAASVEETGTSRWARPKQQSQTPTNNSTEGNQEERFSLSSVKNLFSGGTSGLKKMTAEAKQARAAAKQARAAIKQAEAEAKLLKQMQSDDGIGEIFKDARKAWGADIGKGKLDKDIPIDESLKRVLDKADGNEKYLFKVFGALRKSKVSQDDVFYTLNMANSKTYSNFYGGYLGFLSDFGHRVV